MLVIEKNTLSFVDLPEGTPFKWNGHFFLKTRPVKIEVVIRDIPTLETMNMTSLEDGSHGYLASCEPVIPYCRCEIS